MLLTTIMFAFKQIKEILTDYNWFTLCMYNNFAIVAWRGGGCYKSTLEMLYIA